jgi:hypothetical protein
MSERWIVEKSHKVKAPEYFFCASLDDLRAELQNLADTYRPGPDAPPLGELEFRYELDDDDQVLVVHAYFYNKHNDRSRFARLSRA